LNIFVTGGTGFIVKHLVRNLITKRHKLRSYVRNKEKAFRLFGNKIDVIYHNCLTLLGNI